MDLAVFLLDVVIALLVVDDASLVVNDASFVTDTTVKSTGDCALSSAQPMLVQLVLRSLCVTLRDVLDVPFLEYQRVPPSSWRRWSG